ncbi:hypothetical protein PHISCL_09269 [Aspergillus sclerotialis]|uniref:Uncharacterized protein n=1 Tax=Aspergillus sclerotialis TaxID=2070753 RepID=A0A3A2Z6T1_9EURO|nr:hypothetical protein PHISCL_09269 [Aspergillus sclerotialis]
MAPAATLLDLATYPLQRWKVNVATLHNTGTDISNNKPSLLEKLIRSLTTGVVEKPQSLVKPRRSLTNGWG